MGVFRKADVQAVQECLTWLVLVGNSTNVLEASQKGSTQENRKSSKQIYLTTGRVLPGSQCGHTMIWLLVCTVGATGELRVWKDWLKGNLTCFALGVRVNLCALTVTSLSVTSVESPDSLAGPTKMPGL